MSAKRITIEPLSFTQGGQYYRVLWDGLVLIASTREPLLGACRILLAKGITGRIEMFRSGRTDPDIRADIQRGAGLTVSETADHGPIFVHWKPWTKVASETSFSALTGRPRKPATAPWLPRGGEKNRPSLKAPSQAG